MAFSDLGWEIISFVSTSICAALDQDPLERLLVTSSLSSASGQNL